MLILTYLSRAVGAYQLFEVTDRLPYFIAVIGVADKDSFFLHISEATL